MQPAAWYTLAVFVADLLIRVGLSVRIIMRRTAVGASLAWLLVVLMFPFVGAAAYLLIGENRLGRGRARRAAQIHDPYQQWLAGLSQKYANHSHAISPQFEPLALLTTTVLGIPPLAGNRLELLCDADAILRSIAADIESARLHCHLEFYIWNVGGVADDVAEALIRAAGRRVGCRVLVDAIGSSKFLSSELCGRMRAAGVAVSSALPVGLWRMLVARTDLRLHRKIVVIDGELAYTGSLNLVDPRYFKQGAGVGQWVDAMVRLRGPAVEALAVTFLEDWELETGEGLKKLSAEITLPTLAAQGDSTVQVAPTGPNLARGMSHEVFLTAIYAARRELILTTPYFVPDEPILLALAAAALRGVKVTLIMPALVDSLLVRYACQAHAVDLLAAGVEIALFDAGLLHTKSITVDGQLSIFGSLNMDPRSLLLNFEITLLIDDATFTGELRQLQLEYLSKSSQLVRATVESRSRRQRFLQNAARLLSPLL